MRRGLIAAVLLLFPVLCAHWAHQKNHKKLLSCGFYLQKCITKYANYTYPILDNISDGIVSLLFKVHSER